MHFITLRQLERLNPCIDVLRLRSYDHALYLVELVIDQATYLVQDNQGAALTFRSPLAAKKPFKGLNILRAELVQESAYDEMIGQPLRAQSNALKVNIALPDNDLS